MYWINNLYVCGPFGILRFNFNDSDKLFIIWGDTLKKLIDIANNQHQYVYIDGYSNNTPMTWDYSKKMCIELDKNDISIEYRWY